MEDTSQRFTFAAFLGEDQLTFGLLLQGTEVPNLLTYETLLGFAIGFGARNGLHDGFFPMIDMCTNVCLPWRRLRGGEHVGNAITGQVISRDVPGLLGLTRQLTPLLPLKMRSYRRMVMASRGKVDIMEDRGKGACRFEALQSCHKINTIFNGAI